MHKNNEINERMLLQRLRNDDEAALASLMQLFYADIYNYGRKFSNDEQLVKDCMQEVFISLWQRRDKAADIACPKYYLLRATKNKILKALRRRGRTAFSDSLDDYDFRVEFSVESMIVEKQISEENAARLQRLLSALPARQKEIIYLRFYHQLDQDQIATLMDISRQSVYNLLYESLQKLRKAWQRELITSTTGLGCIMACLV